MITPLRMTKHPCRELQTLEIRTRQLPSPVAIFTSCCLQKTHFIFSRTLSTILLISWLLDNTQKTVHSDLIYGETKYCTHGYSPHVAKREISLKKLHSSTYSSTVAQFIFGKFNTFDAAASVRECRLSCVFLCFLSFSL